MNSFLAQAAGYLWLPGLVVVVAAYVVGYYYTKLKETGAVLSALPKPAVSPVKEGLRWALLTALAAASLTVLSSFYLALGAMSPF